jgi:hypothetical protein
MRGPGGINKSAINLSSPGSFVWALDSPPRPALKNEHRGRTFARPHGNRPRHRPRSRLRIMRAQRFAVVPFLHLHENSREPDLRVLCFFLFSPRSAFVARQERRPSFLSPRGRFFSSLALSCYLTLSTTTLTPVCASSPYRILIIYKRLYLNLTTEARDTSLPIHDNEATIRPRVSRKYTLLRRRSERLSKKAKHTLLNNDPTSADDWLCAKYQVS